MYRDTLLLVGRILIAALFLLSIFPKVTDFSGTAAYMESQGMPFTEILLVGAVSFMLLGSLALITGLKARWGAVLLILFLIPTTFIFHFDLGDPQERIALFKNLAVLGGLFYALSEGPGRYALRG